MSEIDLELKQIQKKISDELDSCIKFWSEYSHDEEQGYVEDKGCLRKFLFLLFLAISPSNHHQIQKGRSVLKTACPEDFKTVLDFQFWSSRC